MSCWEMEMIGRDKCKSVFSSLVCLTVPSLYIRNSFFQVLFQNSDCGLKLILYIFRVDYATFWSFLQGFEFWEDLFLFILETSIYRNSQGHYSFPVADWFCLFIYLWVLPFPLEDCSVILLLPLLYDCMTSPSISVCSY